MLLSISPRITSKITKLNFKRGKVNHLIPKISLRYIKKIVMKIKDDPSKFVSKFPTVQESAVNINLGRRAHRAS